MIKYDRFHLAISIFLFQMNPTIISHTLNCYLQLNDGKEKSSVGNVSKVLPSYRKRACTLGVINEQSEHKQNGNSSEGQPRISEDDTCTKPVNSRPILNHSPPQNNNCFKPALRPTAKAGMKTFFSRKEINAGPISWDGLSP